MTDFNAADRDVNRAIRSWLREDRHEDVTRVAGAVLDQVDTIPQRRATWWPARRTDPMNRILGFGLVAAAAVVALVVGVQLLSSPGVDVGGPGEEPTSIPTPTIEPTTNPTTSPEARGGLPEGPFQILSGRGDDGENEHPPLTVTIPAPGWTSGEAGNPENTGILFKDWVGAGGAGMIIFAQEEYLVFGDSCNWASTPGTTVTTVDEFVAALAAQSSGDAPEAVDVTVGGYPGKAITLRLPDDPSQCDEGMFGSWNCGDPAEPIACGFSEPSETSIDYIFDVDGVIMAWHTDYVEGAPPDAAAELEAIVQSASFGD